MNMLVADVGNSRMKWGHCDEQQVLESVALPLDDMTAWEPQREIWAGCSLWTVAGVNAEPMQRFLRWLSTRGEAFQVLDTYLKLPVKLAVEFPERVGIDRLLNAVAVNGRNPRARPTIVVDAGSAVTVDLIDEEGVFRGGAIFPGLRLMASALHQYTSKLPLVEVAMPLPAMPGTSTVPAIRAGIHGAVAGGINYLVRALQAGRGAPPIVYLTGGDAAMLAPSLEPAAELWPLMTLEGIRLAASR